MNVLFVLENYMPHIGGVEVVFKNLAESLAKQGHNINIVTHRLKNTKEFEIINGVKIHRINCFHSRYWFTFLSIPKVLKLAKKADIVHTTTYNGAFPARIAAKLLKKPSVITIHEVLGKNWNLGFNPASAKLHQLLEWLILKLKFDVFVCVSSSTKKNLEKYKIKNSVVIYNGVDYDFFDQKKYDNRVRKKLSLAGFVYLFYGRPGISKGLENLIKAVPLISKKIPNSKLLAIISKDKAYQKRYNHILNLVKKLNIQKNIIIHDPVKFKELPYFIMAADCVVVPSLTEGFGFAAAEPCAMQKPVVASNVDSLPEIVSGKYVLVKPTPEAIAIGVEMVKNKKYMKTKLKKFTMQENINNYLKVYKKLLSSPKFK